MKQKHIKKFKEIVLPLLGLNTVELIKLAFDKEKTYGKPNDDAIKIAVLSSLLVLADINPKDFELAVDAGYATVCSRQKVGNYVVYRVYGMFAVHNVDTNKVAVLNGLDMEDTDFGAELGITNDKLKEILIKFMIKDLK